MVDTEVIAYSMYKRLHLLPHFDGSEENLEEVSFLRKQIEESDGVLICSPEYAFGIPGSLKNALDWTVGSGELTDKPVAFITASLSGERAHEAMRHVLAALSVKQTQDLLIPFIRSKIKDGAIQPEVRATIQQVVDALIDAV